MDALKGFAPIAHWLPRFALAATFGYHGLPKLRDSAGVAAAMGFAAPMIVLLGLVEVGGAFLILYGGAGAGWATRVAGLAFAAVMAGAIFQVHMQYGWNSVGNMGMEFQVLIVAVSLYFAAKGNDA